VQDLPTGTVTFLFTDVEGSTRLLRELGARAYAEALAEHRRVIREASARHEGVEVDTQGDSFFIAFATAADALAAARETREALSGGPIKVRVGVHTGTPLITDEGYVGADVHRAARIAAAGHGGQVLVSAATRALVGELDLRDLGEHRLKDLGLPERIYQLGTDRFPPLTSLFRTNLPVPATAFLGREDELGRLVDALRDESVRLLTLTGSGGAGKTRLAVQAAAESADLFPDGIAWVGLASVRDPALVVPAVAQSVGLKDEADEPLATRLREHVAGKRLLLLLDNCEHLLPRVADDIAALRDVAGPVLLVTSRERLGLHGERVFAVPPLKERDAVALFVSRAAEIGVGIALASAVAALCARLDYLPLAVELAAARTLLFSPEQLLARIGQRLDLLRGGRETDPRQQTLRTTIAWSHDLLDEDERRLFERLSIFVGGCTYEAAEEVCYADPDTLQSLLDKSLLRRRDSGTTRRYWMLETIREYAAEQLQKSGEAEEFRRRSVTYFVAFTQDAAAALDGAEQAVSLDRLQDELANIRHLLVEANARADRLTQIDLVASIWRFWGVRGYLGEGRDWVERALAGDPVPTDSWLDALHGASNLARRVGDLDAAEQWAGRLLDEARQRERPDTAARALGDLLNVALHRGELDRAGELHEQVVAAFRELGDPRASAASQGNFGYMLALRGRYDAAASHIGESLALYEKLQDAEGQAVDLLNLGAVRVLSGERSSAIPPFRRALTLASTLKHDELAAYAINGLIATGAIADDATAALLLDTADRLLREAEVETEPLERRVQALARESTRTGVPQAERLNLIEAAELALASAPIDETQGDATG
jgi:predicted ATPase/class 3 adenylate cyclase